MIHKAHSLHLNPSRTLAVTTRGFKENEMTIIADVIASILNNPEDEQTFELQKTSETSL